jgi:hypothetical protein
MVFTYGLLILQAYFVFHYKNHKFYKYAENSIDITIVIIIGG